MPQDFPAFPGQKEFSVYAEMHTAKEVGGYFYDFFRLMKRTSALWLETYRVRAFRHPSTWQYRERLEKYLQNHPSDSEDKLLRRIIVDALKFINKAHQSDDITLLVLEYHGVQ